MSQFLLFLLGALSGFVAHAALGRRARRRDVASREVLEGEIARLRAERRQEAVRIAALEQAAAAPDPRIDAENAALRRRMDELADALMRERATPGA